MESCDNNHPEITFHQGGMFSGWNDCPLCEANKGFEEKDEEIESLESKVEEQAERMESFKKWMTKNSHNPDCNYWVTHMEESCTCGLNELLKESK